MNMNMGKIIGIVGGLLLIIGAILPWASFTSGAGNISISGLDTIIFGYPLLIFGIIGLIMCLIGGKAPGIVGIVFGVLALLVSIGGMALLTWLVQLANYSGVVNISTGFGAYLAIIGSILLIVGSAMVISIKKVAAPPAAPPMTPPAAPPMQ